MKKSTMPLHPYHSPLRFLDEKEEAKSSFGEKGVSAARSTHHSMNAAAPMDQYQNKEVQAAAAAAAPKKLERKTTEDINESADAFIKKFRKQLMIQRLESIENYEQMLQRGL